MDQLVMQEFSECIIIRSWELPNTRLYLVLIGLYSALS